MRFAPKRRHVRVDPPPTTSDAPSVLAFGMAKGGSTLLFALLQRLSRRAGLTYFSIENHLFGKLNVGPRERPASIGPAILPAGYCYGGFRHFPAYPIPILGSAKAVLLVRDPRDMITSLYFSLRQSHRIPGETAEGGARAEMERTRDLLRDTAIDSFALEAVQTYIRIFEAYVVQGFLWRPNVAVYRYEDIIFNKAAFVDDLCGWYGWDLPENFRRNVAVQFDELPEEEQPDRHIRQVHPGNHRRHLSPATIGMIDEALSEYMDVFGYR